jgi:hypothetical protein
MAAVRPSRCFVDDRAVFGPRASLGIDIGRRGKCHRRNPPGLCCRHLDCDGRSRVMADDSGLPQLQHIEQVKGADHVWIEFSSKASASESPKPTVSIAIAR